VLAPIRVKVSPSRLRHIVERRALRAAALSLFSSSSSCFRFRFVFKTRTSIGLSTNAFILDPHAPFAVVLHVFRGPTHARELSVYAPRVVRGRVCAQVRSEVVFLAPSLLEHHLWKSLHQTPKEEYMKGGGLAQSLLLVLVLIENG
jgi:hypothetical protein